MRIINPRELITLGIFSVIMVAITMVINMLAVFTPLLIPITKSLSGIVAAIPFVLYVSRVNQAGPIALMAVIIGLVMVLAGDYILTLASALIAGVISDLLCSAARRRGSPLLVVLGYGVFNLWSAGGLLPLIFMRQEIAQQVAQQLGDQYAGVFTALFTVPVVCWTLVGIFISGLAGAGIGVRILHQHFVRAGLVQK
ncbi:MptD family putative ECF transporter S component [Shimwellia pseudoproteus]|uniref:MptD family putative ECF transporter S component n=1 Tax=Shimwellia pseudoproteus TaxID=570012 RepID=UPI0018EBC5EF|nr:MptD family putative ECF transporter S component [Shimwellia pseudoproteus]